MPGNPRESLIIYDDPVTDALTEEQIQLMMKWYESLEARLGVRFNTHLSPYVEGDLLLNLEPNRPKRTP